MAITEGSKVKFLGYTESPGDGGDLLVKDEVYVVAEANEDPETKEITYALPVDNPDFNAKKKASESNPQTILVDVFSEEIEEVTAKASTRSKPAAKEVAKTTAKKSEKAVEKPAAKTKAKTKPAAKAKQEEAEEVEPFSDLTDEEESAEVIELVGDLSGQDLLDLVREVADEAAAVEYKLGGILYHVRKSKAYKDLDADYAENGGFGRYCETELGLQYRKAMYLIQIYYAFSKFQLDSSKVAEIGWAKASKISAVMDEDNATELLALAEGSTLEELNESIKQSYKEVGGTKGEKAKMLTFKFRLFEDAGASVEAILNQVAKSMNFEGSLALSQAFEHVVTEYGVEHDLSKPAKAAGKTPTTTAAKPTARRSTAKA